MKPQKSQVKPELRYYPVTLLRMAKALGKGFKALKYKLYPSCSDCKYSRIFGISANEGEKSSVSGAIASICCDLRIEEQLCKE